MDAKIFKSKGKQPRLLVKVLKSVLSEKDSKKMKTAKRQAWKQPSFKDSVIAHWSSFFASKMYKGLKTLPKQ